MAWHRIYHIKYYSLNGHDKAGFNSCYILVFCVILLRSEFRVVMSITISAYKQCSVRLYLQLFVGGFVSYIVICVCLLIFVSNTHCVVFLFCFSRLVYLMLPGSLDCPFFYWPFGILYRLFSSNITNAPSSMELIFH